MATIDTSLFPTANVRFQMAEAPSGFDMAEIQRQKLANQASALNLANAQRAAQRQKMTDAMRDVMGHETPEDAIAAIDKHVASGDMTAEQAADAKSKVPTRNADGSLPAGAMTAWRQRNFDDYLASNEQLYESQTRKQQQQQLQDILSGGAPAPAPTNALASAAPVDQEQALFNQLNPSAATPTVAPTNALVPPTQDDNALRQKILALYAMNTPAATAAAKMFEDQLPKAATQTEFDKKWALFQKQYPNGTYEQFVKLSQSPGTTVTVSTAGPKAEQEAKGKANVDVANEVRTAGNEARKQLVNTDLMEKLLDEGLKTGFATETQAKIANALTKLGVENAGQYATNAQAFQSFVRQNVLNEQKQQKGVQTEGDAQRIEETFARLSNTPDANKFLLATKRAVNNKAIKQQKFWNDWWTKNKTYEGVEDAWLNGEGSKSIFDDPSMKKYAPQPAGAKAPPKVGEIVKGHKFKGGNPSDPNSWEVVK